MAGGVKGIIVEIGGDTSGLKKALREVNSATSSLSKELKGINTLLNLNPKNTELLSQKQQVLKESIKATSDELSVLKDIQEKFIQSGGNVNSDKYRDLQRDIIKTESELEKLKIEASNWTKVSNSLQEVESKMKKWGGTIENIGNQLTTKISLPIIALGTAATKSAIDFESAFAGVEKTVDGTTEQMLNLKNGIKNMAQEIPSSTTEIAEVAEAAGQLGIKTDDILEFTRVMIDLGESTNLSANDAASSLAKLANIVGMSSSDYKRLGSAIVGLGNNFATTENDIVQMSTRLAATGNLAGLETNQILALATAMSSVGIEAEAGGSAMSKLLKMIQVATETGSQDLEDFAKVAGMTTEQFKMKFEKDAVGALSLFIKGLNDTERNGKSAIAILDDMNLKEVRLSNTILSLASAGDLLTDAVELSSKAWNENTALTNETEKRYSTIQSKLVIVKNKLYDLGITLGEYILPYVEKSIDFVSNLIEKFKKINPNIQKMIVKILAITAAMGPFISILGKLIGFGGTIAGTFSKVSGVIARVSSSAGGLSGVLSALTGPVGVVIAVIAALTAAFIYLFKTNSEFHDKVINTWNGVCEMFTGTVMPILEELWQKFSEVFQQILHIVMNLWKKIEPLILEMFNWWLDFWENTLKDIVVQIIEFIAKLWEFQAEIYSKFILPIIEILLDVLWPAVEWIVKNIIEKNKDVLEHVWNIIHSIVGVLNGLIDFISGVFSGDWEKAWNGISKIFENVMGGLWEIVKWPLNKIIDGINTFIGGVNNIQIPDWVPNVGGKGLNIPKIPKLAKGGIVNEATLALVGEGKSAEAVIPLDRTLTKYIAAAMREAGGSRNITLNFYPQTMDEQELDRAFNYVEKKFSLAY